MTRSQKNWSLPPCLTSLPCVPCFPEFLSLCAYWLVGGEDQHVIGELFVASACWVTLAIFIVLLLCSQQALQWKCDKLKLSNSMLPNCTYFLFNFYKKRLGSCILLSLPLSKWGNQGSEKKMQQPKITQRSQNLVSGLLTQKPAHFQQPHDSQVPPSQMPTYQWRVAEVAVVSKK